MTPERAKEIAEEIRSQPEAERRVVISDAAGLLLYLYDELQAIKAAQSGLAFMSAGIRPVTKVDQ